KKKKKNNFKKIKIRNIDIIMFIMFLLYFFKCLYTEIFNEILNLGNPWFYYILYYILFNYTYFLFFRNLDIKNAINRVIKTIIFSGFIFGIIILVFYNSILFESEIGRFGANIEDNDESILSPLSVAYSGALNTSLLIPYISSNFKNSSIIKKIYLLINLIISILLFVLGSTRGALVVVFLSLLFFVFTKKGYKKILYIMYSIPLVLLFLFMVNSTGSSLLDRVNSTIETNDTSGRDYLWKEAMAEFYKYPLIGGRIEVSGIYPHNLFIEILMSTGVIGIILFILLFFNSIKNVKINNDTIYIYIILINGLFFNMFSGSFYTAILLFTGLGMLNGYKYSKKI
ncbi:O-antigen ligase family protein, partial [Empedobacter falsenii]